MPQGPCLINKVHQGYETLSGRSRAPALRLCRACQHIRMLCEHLCCLMALSALKAVGADGSTELLHLMAEHKSWT